MPSDTARATPKARTWTPTRSSHARRPTRSIARLATTQLTTFSARLCPVASTGHPHADEVGGCVGGIFAGDLALVQRHDPVRQRVDLVELGRDQQDRAPLGLLLEDLSPHELDRPDVEASCGLRG